MQKQGERGGADRPAHALADIYSCCGTGKRLARHGGIGGGGRRDGDGAHAEAAHEQGDAQRHDGNIGAEQREGQGAEQRQERSGAGDRPRAKSLAEPAHDGEREEHAQRHWRQQQAGGGGGEGAYAQQIKRDEELAAEIDCVGQELRRRGGAEYLAGEQAQVDQGGGALAVGMQHEGSQQKDGDGQANECTTVAVGQTDQAFQQQGQAGGNQRQPHQIEPAWLHRFVARQHGPGKTDRQQADRNIHPEDPAPAEVGEDQPAQAGAEHLSDHHRHGGDADHARHVPSGVARHHHLHHWRQQPAGDALQHPAGDQHGQRGRGARQGGTGHEHGETGQKDTPRADPVHQPAGQRQSQRQGQQIGAGNPLDGAERGIEHPPQMIDGDIHHRRIQPRHHRATGTRGRDHPDAAIDFVGVGGVGGRHRDGQGTGVRRGCHPTWDAIAG